MGILLRLQELEPQVYTISVNVAIMNAGDGDTCEDWRFKQLYKLVNLYQHVDRHLKLGTRIVKY